MYPSCLPPQYNLCTSVREFSSDVSVKRSKCLLNSKQTPPIPLPNNLLGTSTESVTIPKQKIKKKKKVEHMQFNWVNGNKIDFEVDIPDYGYASQQDDVLTPFEYFDKFFYEDLFEHIKEQ